MLRVSSPNTLGRGPHYVFASPSLVAGEGSETRLDVRLDDAVRADRRPDAVLRVHPDHPTVTSGSPPGGVDLFGLVAFDRPESDERVSAVLEREGVVMTWVEDGGYAVADRELADRLL